MNQFTITKKQAAYLLGCDERSLTAYQRRKVDPLPIMKKGKRGQCNEYDPHAIHEWKIRQIQSRYHGKKLVNSESERTRLLTAQADQITLRNNKEKEKVIDIEDVNLVLQITMTTIVNHLEAIPGRCAHTIANISDPSIIRQELQKEIRYCRQIMAEKLQQYANTGKNAT